MTADSTRADLPAEPEPRLDPRRVWRQVTRVLKIAGSLLKETYLAWLRDNARQLGAALSFYAALSLAPLVVLMTVIAGRLFGDEAVAGQFAERIETVVGGSVANVIEMVVANASTTGSGLVATVVSIATLIYGGSGMFAQLRKTLNWLWQLEPKPGGGLLRTIRNRLLSILMLLVAGSLLIVILMLDTIAGAMNQAFGPLVPILPDLVAVISLLQTLQIVKFVVGFVVFMVIFAIIYKTVPNASVAWQDAWIGGVVTSLLLTLGNFLIGIYLRYSSVGSAYGAAGSLLALLVWVYYSAQVFFFGAEFTQVYANRYGSRIIPDRGAVHIVRQRRSREEVLDLMEPKPPLAEKPQSREMPPAERQPEPPAPPAPPASSPPERPALAVGYGALAAAAVSFVAGLLVGIRRRRDDT